MTKVCHPTRKYELIKCANVAGKVCRARKSQTRIGYFRQKLTKIEYICLTEGRKERHFSRLVSKDLTRCSAQLGLQSICAGYLSTRTQLHVGGYITAAYV